MQRRLIDELKEGNRSPLELHESGRRIEGRYLGEFIARAAEQMQDAAQAITEGQFTRITDLLADPKREVFYALGGRISDTIATHLSFHLRQVRENVFHLPRDPESWPDYLLRMKPGDIFFLVDFRRYQPNLTRLAAQVHEISKAQVILMTDKWLSPAHRYADEVLSVPIDTGTIWDSTAPGWPSPKPCYTGRRRKLDKYKSRIKAWDAARQISGEADT